MITGLLIFFFNLGGRDLWDPDETRYAVVAREMRETGQWILPHFCSSPLAYFLFTSEET
jgi:4-amino-4-deoxy-L-arabinose transferase-like glycosyltransferase